VNFDQLDSEIENYIDGNITLELQSAPGVGKSSWARALSKRIAKKKGLITPEGKSMVGFGAAFLATYTPIDLLGYMVPVKKQIAHWDPATGGVTMREQLVSEYTMPPWMLSEEGQPLNAYPFWMLVLDEYDKGEPDVKKTSAELLLHGAIGPHKLDMSRGVIIALSNRNKDRSGSTKTFDFIVNRRGTIYVESEFDPWERWALENGYKPIFTTFARKNRGDLFNNEIPKEQGAWMTPRSYDMAVRLLEARNARVARETGSPPDSTYGLQDERTRSLIQTQLTGLIGEGKALELTSWLQMRLQTPDIADIVKDPMGTKIPDELDAKYLTVYQCGFEVNEANAGPVVKYISRFLQEYQVTFAKAAIKRNHALVLNPHMDKFVKANAALLNIIT
jgi:hypothetical protein